MSNHSHSSNDSHSSDLFISYQDDEGNYWIDRNKDSPLNRKRGRSSNNSCQKIEENEEFVDVQDSQDLANLSLLSDESRHQQLTYTRVGKHEKSVFRQQLVFTKSTTTMVNPSSSSASTTTSVSGSLQLIDVYNFDAMNPYFPETKAAGTTVEITFGDEGVTPKYALGYWSIRGLGAPLTMMLCAAKVPFTLFLYDIHEKGEGGGWKSDYFTEKPFYVKEYDAPLFNLPFCADRENKMVISQTNAIFSHLGRACGMLGNDVPSTSNCEQLLCELYDLRNIIVKFSYGDAMKNPEDVLTMAKKHFVRLEAWLEQEAKIASTKATKEDKEELTEDKENSNGGLVKINENVEEITEKLENVTTEKAEESAETESTDVVHLVNGSFTAPDFHLFEMLDQYEAFSRTYLLGSALDAYPRLKAFKEGFAALEENQFYLKSWLHTELPFNSLMAKFGSLPGPKTYVYGKSTEKVTWMSKGFVKMSP